jgi:hypothetical protein
MASKEVTRMTDLDIRRDLDGDGSVPNASIVEKRASRRSVAAAVVVGFGGLALFQLVLAAGAPLGAAAWGGKESQLPAGLRVASGLAVLFYGVAALVVLRRGGFQISLISAAFARWGTWVLVVILALSGVANLLSESAWERFLMGPAALVLAALSLIVARNSDDPADARAGENGAALATRTHRSSRAESVRWLGPARGPSSRPWFMIRLSPNKPSRA